jgi:hypothetical protein
MAYYDGTNLIFRLRVGGISAGAKAYSILIDADFKAGNSLNSSQPDPNYVAPTAQGTGNIGFEWEVLLATGNSTSVILNNVDGKTNSTIVPVTLTTGTTGWQISKALSTNSNNADYFYDFYVPVSAFTGTYAITSTTQFRIVATTVNSPTSALAGSRSDIWGGNDQLYTSTPEEWYEVLGKTPPVTLTKLSSSGSVGGICTNPPTITSSSVTIGTAKSISGTWTKNGSSTDNAATITIYRYSSSGSLLTTYTSTSAYPSGITSGSPWTITGITVTAGDYFIAKAKGTSSSLNESECMQSNTIYAVCSGTAPTTPVISCASTKGINGTIQLGATVEIYNITTSNLSTTATPLTTNLIYTNNTTDQTFNYYGANPTTGSACGGNTGIFATGTTLMFVSVNGGCKSTPYYGCVTGSNNNSTISAIGTNDLVFTTPIYTSSTVSGTSVTGFALNDVLRLYVNDVYVTGYTVSAATNAFSFSSVSLKINDVVKVMKQSSGSCATFSTTATVTCYNQPPIITTDANGNILTTATSISGTATANATVTLNKTNATTASYTVTADASGNWTKTGLSLVAGDTYTATITTSTCNTASTASAIATVVTPTTTCPTITNTYTDANTTVTGTVNVTVANSVVRLYLDGTLVGSQTWNTVPTPNAQSWSITPSQPFYSGAAITATFQAGSTASENTSCSNSTTVSCSSPAAPSISPTSTSISQNSTVNYSISSGQTNTWYSVLDASGTSYATAVYNTGSNNTFSLLTGTFNTIGNYTLRLTTDNLTGCAPSYTTATVQVNAIVMPTNFLSIAAKKASEGVAVNWEVSNEVNVAYYIVERSTDGWNYETAGKVAYRATTATSNKYAFVDIAVPESGKFYYRIKQVDLDGEAHYSKFALAKWDAIQKVQLWPNPAAGQVTILLSTTSSGKVGLELFDLTGRRLQTRQLTVQQGSNNILLNNLGKFSRGHYILKVSTDKGTTYNKLQLK